MRFMAVFIQLDTCHAVGFEDLTDAIDFLFWGYEEHDLLPCGTYDLLTGETAAYEHRGRFIGLYDPDLIRQTATEYVRASLRLMGRSSRQNGTSPGRVL
ncbi:hypothetical protein GCM10027423_30480 [Spirosoma arcticum]